jgi:carboxymethylenebutenolidase
MMNARILFLVIALCFTLTAQATSEVSATPETVIVQSGELKLRALLYRPQGRGPFPAVLFNHGSRHTDGTLVGGPDHRHPELLGPVFERQGYVFLY